jgi:hypothetical protein
MTPVDSHSLGHMPGTLQAILSTMLLTAEVFQNQLVPFFPVHVVLIRVLYRRSISENQGFDSQNSGWILQSLRAIDRRHCLPGIVALARAFCCLTAWSPGCHRT